MDVVSYVIGYQSGLKKGSGQGVELPELENPAGAAQIRAGYEAIGPDGAVIGGEMPNTALDFSGINFDKNTGKVTVRAAINQSGYIEQDIKNDEFEPATLGATTIEPGAEDQVIEKHRWLTGDITVKAVTGGGGSGGGGGVCVVRDYNNSMITTISGTAGTATLSLSIPEDATDVYAEIKFSATALSSSYAVLAENFFTKTVVANPDDITYTATTNAGYKSAGIVSATITGAPSGTSTIRVNATGYVSFRMPNTRIENNTLYADTGCTGLFYYHSSSYRHSAVYLEGVDLRGSNVQIICPSTFYGYSELKKVWLSEQTTKIDAYAFEGCTGLEEVHFTSITPPQLGSSVFKNVPTTCKIYVPAGRLSAYTSASNYPSASNYTYIEE